MLNIILFGPPGSGKGTQAERLVQRYNLRHISTGELLRAEQARGTHLGIQLQQTLASGNLVEDEVVDALIDQELSIPSTGFIFDGYPRTAAQAKRLITQLAAKNITVNHVFELTISDTLLEQRVCGRVSCAETKQGYHMLFNPPPENCTLVRRPEDNPIALRERLQRYHSRTQEAIDLFHHHPGYRVVDGSKAISEVWDEIDRTIS